MDFEFANRINPSLQKRKTHLRTKGKNIDSAKIPIYFIEHSYNFILRSHT